MNALVSRYPRLAGTAFAELSDVTLTPEGGGGQKVDARGTLTGALSALSNWTGATPATKSLTLKGTVSDADGVPTVLLKVAEPSSLSITIGKDSASLDVGLRATPVPVEGGQSALVVDVEVTATLAAGDHPLVLRGPFFPPSGLFSPPLRLPEDVTKDLTLQQLHVLVDTGAGAIRSVDASFSLGSKTGELTAGNGVVVVQPASLYLSCHDPSTPRARLFATASGQATLGDSSNGGIPLRVDVSYGADVSVVAATPLEQAGTHTLHALLRAVGVSDVGHWPDFSILQLALTATPSEKDWSMIGSVAGSVDGGDGSLTLDEVIFNIAMTPSGESGTLDATVTVPFDSGVLKQLASKLSISSPLNMHAHVMVESGKAWADQEAVLSTQLAPFQLGRVNTNVVPRR